LADVRHCADNLYRRTTRRMQNETHAFSASQKTLHPRDSESPSDDGHHPPPFAIERRGPAHPPRRVERHGHGLPSGGAFTSSSRPRPRARPMPSPLFSETHAHLSELNTRANQFGPSAQPPRHRPGAARGHLPPALRAHAGSPSSPSSRRAAHTSLSTLPILRSASTSSCGTRQAPVLVTESALAVIRPPPRHPGHPPRPRLGKNRATATGRQPRRRRQAPPVSRTSSTPPAPPASQRASPSSIRQRRRPRLLGTLPLYRSRARRRPWHPLLFASISRSSRSSARCPGAAR